MKITFDKYDFRIKEVEDQKFIFDVIRKKFVALAPEEWVRQHWIHYLIHHQKYPRSRIAAEMKIKLNGLTKRCDLVVFDKSGNPFLIVECKAPEIKITQKTFDQIARYNLTLNVKYLVVSNGNKHFCCAIDAVEMKYEFLDELPSILN
ncbi:MAG: type I restriction enzyme HsdR N-terminal domain-containing protein [Chitinophagales bacterium]|nr:type I restriction enzyme HsdR N-terminal domain-containing protein [Chitinophagales bacterium]